MPLSKNKAEKKVETKNETKLKWFTTLQDNEQSNTSSCLKAKTKSRWIDFRRHFHRRTKETRFQAHRRCNDIEFKTIFWIESKAKLTNQRDHSSKKAKEKNRKTKSKISQTKLNRKITRFSFVYLFPLRSFGFLSFRCEMNLWAHFTDRFQQLLIGFIESTHHT